MKEKKVERANCNGFQKSVIAAERQKMTAFEELSKNRFTKSKATKKAAT
jgi:hypothetical protein